MMDRTDYQILNLLQDDSRCTLRRMGDLVGLTPPAVSERIRRMEESGVIRGYHIDIDRTKLDCNITGFISVALEPDKYDKFCDFCASQSAIISHYHMVGEFNALLRFAVRDTQLGVFPPLGAELVRIKGGGHVAVVRMGHPALRVQVESRLQFFLEIQLARQIFGRVHVGDVAHDDVLPLELHVHHGADQAYM